MNLAFIYEKLLKPKLEIWLGDETQRQTLATAVLDVYQFLCARSHDEVLISPRELEMMLILAASYHQRYPHVPLMDVIAHYRYVLVAPLVPLKDKASFDAHFKPATPLPRPSLDTSSSSSSSSTDSDFYLTPSREPTFWLLHDLLALRQAKRETAIQSDTERSVLFAGGLGGLVLEGEAGIGKSELMQYVLRHYQLLSPTENYPVDVIDRGYYHIPMSMDLEARRALLLKAFDEGALVLIDEINASPFLEDLLNALLMGKTPDNKPPKRPGFLLLATQNPSTMEGRLEASPALRHRWINPTLPPYPPEEVQQTMAQKHIEEPYAKPLLDAYLQIEREAKQFDSMRCPNIRDIEAVRDKVIALQDNPAKLTTHLFTSAEADSSSLSFDTSCTLQ